MMHSKLDAGAGPREFAAPGPMAVRAPAGSSVGANAGAVLGAAAILVAAVSSMRRRKSAARGQVRTVVCAENEAGGDKPKWIPRKEWREKEMMSGKIYRGRGRTSIRSKNYVNPWDQKVVPEEGNDAEVINRYGWEYHKYTGPVYKKVPIVEGLTFPLDPLKYKGPLEPPPPGKKWGDGRSADGNWYMEVDGVKTEYWQGVGRRKTACAIVRIVKDNAKGSFIINGRDAVEYLRLKHLWWLKATEPIAAISQKNNFDIIVKTFGGGTSSQAGAIRHGLARALQEYNFNWRPLLKQAKYLTRDWRTVEGKKTGQPKARKDVPYHKR